jgi:hypothetical protein
VGSYCLPLAEQCVIRRLRHEELLDAAHTLGVTRRSCHPRAV